jgi:hypothetical protein
MPTKDYVSSCIHSLSSKILTFGSLIWKNGMAVRCGILNIDVVTDLQKYGNSIVGKEA